MVAMWMAMWKDKNVRVNCATYAAEACQGTTDIYVIQDPGTDGPKSRFMCVLILSRTSYRVKAEMGWGDTTSDLGS